MTERRFIPQTRQVVIVDYDEPIAPCSAEGCGGVVKFTGVANDAGCMLCRQVYAVSFVAHLRRQ